MKFERAKEPRPPLNGWVRKQEQGTPAFFVKVENDIETGQIVTEEELRLFYKKYGILLRGVKQRAQIEIVSAAKLAGPGYEFAGLDANKQPTFKPAPVADTTSPDATGDSTTLEGASSGIASDFVPSER